MKLSTALAIFLLFLPPAVAFAQPVETPQPVPPAATVATDPDDAYLTAAHQYWTQAVITFSQKLAALRSEVALLKAENASLKARLAGGGK